jgi:hypothetical protein
MSAVAFMAADSAGGAATKDKPADETNTGAGEAGNTDSPAADKTDAPATDAPKTEAVKLTPELVTALKVGGDLKGTVITDKAVIGKIHKVIGGGKTSAQRAYFPTQEALVEGLGKFMAETNNFGGLPVIAFNVDNLKEGEGIPEDSEWHVATVTRRTKGINALVAVTVYPTPSTQRFIDEQRAYVDELIRRQSADTVFSLGVREAENTLEIQQSIDRTALTTAAFLESSRESMDTAAFDDLWADFRAAFIKQRPAFADAIPQKPLVLKAFRSASFAAQNPYTAALEEKKGPDGKSSVWDLLLSAFIKMVKSAKDPKTGESLDYDTETLEMWAANRATFVLSAGFKEVKLEDLSVDFG